MMKDTSHGAEIAHLKQRLEALETRHPAPTEEQASDLVEFDRELERDAREARVQKAKQLLKERTELLKRIDESIEALGEFVRAEMALRRDIEAAGLLRGLDKYLREQLKADAQTNGHIQSRLASFGIGGKRGSRDVPKLLSLAGIHARIISAIQGK